MRLIIDIGNTLVKYALFNNDKLLQLSKKNEVDHNYINQIISKNSVNSVIVSSVRKKIDWNVNTKLVVLNHTTKLPITINYETPKTLGNDRIANVVAASVLYPNKNILVIDAGTCITFDLIDLNKVFLGGS